MKSHPYLYLFFSCSFTNPKSFCPNEGPTNKLKCRKKIPIDRSEFVDLYLPVIHFFLTDTHALA